MAALLTVRSTVGFLLISSVLTTASGEWDFKLTGSSNSATSHQPDPSLGNGKHRIDQGDPLIGDGQGKQASDAGPGEDGRQLDRMDDEMSRLSPLGDRENVPVETQVMAGDVLHAVGLGTSVDAFPVDVHVASQSRGDRPSDLTNPYQNLGDEDANGIDDEIMTEPVALNSDIINESQIKENLPTEGGEIDTKDSPDPKVTGNNELERNKEKYEFSISNEKDNSLPEQKRKFDSISNGRGFYQFGKRRFDSIAGNRAFSSFGKRRFDTIGNSAFSSFGKRRFDPIGNSAFSSFGKRRFDPIGNSAFSSFGKRRFDPIGNSAFSSFGKRRFDPIGNSGFRSFGKKASDSLYDNPPAISQRSEEGIPKRSFDRISHSRFSAFGKKSLDSIASSGFVGFKRTPLVPNNINAAIDDSNKKKRAFDSISRSHFRSFGKRKHENIASGSSFASFGKREPTNGQPRNEKRTFDSISRVSSFGTFGKRSQDFHESEKGDSMEYEHHVTSNSRKKREAEEVNKRSIHSLNKSDKSTQFGSTRSKRDLEDSNDTDLDLLAPHKRSFDSISGKSTFGMFGKRASHSDPLDFVKRLLSDKRRFDPISSDSFGNFGKRAFDRIGNSAFRNFGKRHFDRIGYSTFSSFGRGKRRFDRISSASSFGSFGKRQSKGDLDSSHLTSTDQLSDSDREYQRLLLFLLDNLSTKDLMTQDLKSDALTPADLTLSPHGSLKKRRFDSIDNRSAFRRFGRYNGRPGPRFALMPDRNPDLSWPTLDDTDNNEPGLNSDFVNVLLELYDYVHSLQLQPGKDI